MRLGTLLGQHCVLIWFWDYTSLNSLRALPYLKEWHRRYADKGLAIVGVHSPQFDFGKKLENVAEAVERLEIEFPVASDAEYDIWKLYGNEVWPSTYLWNRSGVLQFVHFAEGAYQETERLIGELLLEIDDRLELPEPMAPLRDTDADRSEGDPAHAAHLPQRGAHRRRRSRPATSLPSGTRAPAPRRCSTVAAAST